ncbi:hypothetical protein [Aminobacter niigataensis]|nr:hypothetical protein [Aminobacter niigataensis]CAI2932182.1 protein of unknown function [Aminobacter niigataensis]
MRARIFRFLSRSGAVDGDAAGHVTGLCHIGQVSFVIAMTYAEEET